MKQRWYRIWLWLALFAGGGITFGGVGFTRTGLGRSCSGTQLYANGLFSMVDFCFLLDCNNGFLGGLLQPCGSANTAADDFLIDCSPAVSTDDDDQT